jgi:hypothetical protein
MSVLVNFLSFIRLCFINPGLLLLALKVKHSGRTYLSYSTIYSLVSNYLSLQKLSSTAIQVAEFGVGRGGSATILAWLVNRYNGKLSLYDVFGLIPAPTEKDGEGALIRYKYIITNEGNDYYGNISNLRDIIQNELYKVCLPDNLEIIQGKYEDVLPNLNDDRKFNLIHIDCDWYESSKVVYSYIQTRLRPGSIIQVDDYSFWEGSTRAYHDTTWLINYQTHLIDGALVIDTSKTKNNQSFDNNGD